MAFKFLPATFFLPVLLTVLPATHNQALGQFSNQSCVVSGNTLSSAVAAYRQQCTLPRTDCDPIDGIWYCASFTISSGNQAGLSGLTDTQPAVLSIEANGAEANGAASNAAGVALPPVFAPTAGTNNGHPICLSDANDATGSGYGFENNQSCVVVAGVTASRDQPLVNQRICTPWFEIAYGNYRLQNNTWNDTAVDSDNWSQCIELTGNSGNYIAKWDYNWLQQNEGNEFAVKSYPQVYYGQKTQFNRSGTVEQTGLPALTDSLQQIWVEYDYSETGNAERNVALESFFHTSCEVTEENKQYEMMVWVGVPSIRTPGVLVTSVSLSGQDWDVYTNPSLGWAYVAFVARQPGNSGILDWNAFVNWSRFNGPDFGVPAMANNTCMGAVEIGTETFWGTGTFSLNRFNVTGAR